MILISFKLKLGFCSSDFYLINVDLLLSFTSEGGVPQQQHHRVDVVSHPRPLDLEVPLEQAFLTFGYIIRAGLRFRTRTLQNLEF